MATDESKQLVRKESMRKENQISVDPVSLRESSRGEASFNFMLPPVSTAPAPDLLPPAMPAKSQLIAGSLPSSACSSPRFSFTMLKKKSKNESQASRFQIDNLVGRHSLAHPPLASDQQEIHMRRSKSCGEGRTAAPAEELNLWFPGPNAGKSDNGPHGHFKTEARKDNMAGANMDPIDDRFKCGALCLYLPGFAKGKPVRPKKEARGDLGNVISRTVSVERFECGSWASSAIINDYEDDFKNLFFDLPLEFIQTSANDANSPVAAAFVFDKDRKRALKSCSTRAEPRKSYEFSRHVRFSTSSPTSHPTSPTSCITPRLLKAREEFNVFLEAQSA